MRFRNTLLLLLVLIGLGAYVYWVDMPEAEKAAQKDKLLDFQADEITAIVLTYPDREVALAKAGDTWKLTRPIEADADDVAVKSLLSLLAGGEVKKGLDDIADLAPYGLDKPSTTVALQAGDKALPVIKVGKAAPIGGSAYALRGDEKSVLLTTSAVRSGVDKSLKDLRNKSVLAFTDDEVRKIEIESADAEDVIVSREGDAWKITAPGSYDADPNAVRAYLSTLRSLRANDFPDEKADLAVYGLDAPKTVVTLTVGDNGGREALLLGGSNDKNERYVKTASSPVIYTVGEWVSKDLAKPVGDLRDKSVLVFDRDEVKAIEVSRQDGAGFTLARGDDGKWTLAGVEGAVNQAAAIQLAGDLATLKGHAIAADDVVDLAAWGLEPPAMTAKVTGADGTDVGTILLGQHDVDGKPEYTAMRAGSGTVLLVRDFNYTRLDKKAADLVDAPTPSPAG